MHALLFGLSNTSSSIHSINTTSRVNGHSHIYLIDPLRTKHTNCVRLHRSNIFRRPFQLRDFYVEVSSLRAKGAISPFQPSCLRIFVIGLLASSPML